MKDGTRCVVVGVPWPKPYSVVADPVKGSFIFSLGATPARFDPVRPGHALSCSRFAFGFWLERAAGRERRRRLLVLRPVSLPTPARMRRVNSSVRLPTPGTSRTSVGYWGVCEFLVILTGQGGRWRLFGSHHPPELSLTSWSYGGSRGDCSRPGGGLAWGVVESPLWQPWRAPLGAVGDEGGFLARKGETRRKERARLEAARVRRSASN
jgi:hypothetical protein